MSKTLYMLLTLSCLALGKLSAQELEMLGTSRDRKPVLIDDSNADKLRALEEKLHLSPQQYILPESLTAEQQDAVALLEESRAEAFAKLNNDLAAKKSKLRDQEIAENAKQKAINKTIDSIAIIYGKAMKTNAAHKQHIRSILTPSQRTEFDSMNY